MTANIHTQRIPWKRYLTTLSECLLAFAITTFCIALYFTRCEISIIESIVLIILYVFVIGVCVKRIAQQFSLAAIMLMIPLAPLVPLVFVMLLIPILQYL